MNDVIRYSTRLLVCAATIGASASAAWATAPSFTLLGDLPGGIDKSYGYGASADGLVALGRSYVEPNVASYEAFRWIAPLGIISLGDLPGGTIRGFALDANSDGSVIVGSSVSANGEEAFVWTEAGGMIGIGDLPDNTFSSRANAVNGDGTIVVGSHLAGAVYPTSRKAFVWSPEMGMVSLGTASLGCEALDISRSNFVIVGYTATSGTTIRPAKWTIADGWVTLGNFPGGSSNGEARAANADGSIIVGFSGSTFSPDPFMWTQATGMVSLGQLPGFTHSGPATGVNFDGSLVVGPNWLWTPSTGIVPMTGTLKNILGIHVLGTIIGEPSLSDDGRTIVASTTDWQPDDHGVVDPAMACRIVLPGPGACCIGGGCVDDIDPIACATYCGVFISDESTCAAIACEGYGACMFRCTVNAQAPCPASGPEVFPQCVVLSEADCVATGGLFVGGDCNCRESILRCPTDINGDGSTNIADFNVLASNFGQGNPDCRTPWEGDLTCDGVVDISDFNILAGDFGCGN